MLREMAGDMERALGALRDFTRRDILLRFYADRKPRSVDDVARESGVHRSVAFEHLERLVVLVRGVAGRKSFRADSRQERQIGHPLEILRRTNPTISIFR